MINRTITSKIERTKWQARIWREKNLTIKNLLLIFSPLIILFLFSPYLTFRVVKYSANSKIYDDIDSLPIQQNTGVVLISDFQDIDGQIKTARIESGIELLRKNRVDNLVIVISKFEDQNSVQDILNDKNISLDNIEIILYTSFFEMCKSFKAENKDYLAFISNKENLALAIYNCSSRDLLTHGLNIQTKDEPEYDNIDLIKTYFSDVIKNNLDF